MNKATNIIGLVILLALIALGAACSGAATESGMKVFATKKVSDNLTITLSGEDGKLKNGQQEIMLSFTDGSGKPVEIKAATLNFNMPAMGSMAEMNNAAELTTTGTPGQFKGNLNIEMKGDWIAQVSYEGAESGKTTISTKAQ
ncbi:MAG: FixH family protein [Pyrinomonadaceae bacterium]|nr:FixH family protein [Pyrinomonadaceae bacterium]